MSSSWRLEVEGTICDVTSREAFFNDDEDRFSFLEVLSEALGRFDTGGNDSSNHDRLILRRRLDSLG